MTSNMTLSIVTSVSDSPFSLTNHEVWAISSEDSGALARRAIMIATWVMPGTLSKTNPRLILALSKGNYSHDIILASGYFLASMLAVGQEGLVPIFGGQSSRDADKFGEARQAGFSFSRYLFGFGVGVKQELGKQDCTDVVGSLESIAGSCGWCYCQVSQQLDIGDRTVVVADIVDSAIDKSKAPLRKKEALAAMPDNVAKTLYDKAIIDGIRDTRLLPDRNE